MKKNILHLLLIITLLFTMVLLMGASGCSSKTSGIGDGKVDAIEAATIQIAVGLAMTAKPETVAPAYAVSTALLAVMDGADPVGLDTLNAVLAERTAQLELTAGERQSVMALVGLVRAGIKKQLNLPDIKASQKLVVVRDVLEIVRATASARLHVGS